MATLRELIIKISANSQSFRRKFPAPHAWGRIITEPCKMAVGRLPLPPERAKGRYLI